ncbi:MAG: hypothetical protein QOJ07_1279, partial [Thermoleophilaceae bacterium]|nr:hypothetical protein [Thermoleophilaceae bacterium]
MRHGLTGHGDGHSRWRRFALAALLAFATLLAVAPRAHGATGMEVAVQDDDVFVAGSAIGRAKGVSYAHELGVTRIRVNVTWADTVIKSQRKDRKAPKTIKYDWTAYDQLVLATRGTGINLQLALTGPAPAFASGDHKIGPVKPKAKYYADFARAAAEHFGANVDRYSIWNEPNYVSWISPNKGAGRIYRALYVAGYKAIKKAQPSAQVLIAETSPYKIVKKGKQFASSPLAFLREMTCSNASFSKARCGGLVADGYAHHPYDFDHKPSYRFPGSDNATLATLGNLTGAL